MRSPLFASMLMLLLGSCSAGKAGDGQTSAAGDEAPETIRPAFDADSAYSFVERQVAFGPRVPNTEAHRLAGDWLSGKLRSYGWTVVEQTPVLTAFDGTRLQSRNIFASLNPDLGNRTLLLSHWDCRPWADQDPDRAKRSLPVDGANDGASGVGVLLEIARQLAGDSTAAVDILLVDAEDWGAEHDEDSWALGTRYFAENPPVSGYRPAQAILLDMVGSPDARFGYEYFSEQANRPLLDKIWSHAGRLGHGSLFQRGFGGAVTDDHVQLIQHGIPAVDIIDYRYSADYQGFDPTWHTSRDGMDNISPSTLGAVGETILSVIKH